MKQYLEIVNAAHGIFCANPSDTNAALMLIAAVTRSMTDTSQSEIRRAIVASIIATCLLNQPNPPRYGLLSGRTTNETSATSLAFYDQGEYQLDPILASRLPAVGWSSDALSVTRDLRVATFAPLNKTVAKMHVNCRLYYRLGTQYHQLWVINQIKGNGQKYWVWGLTQVGMLRAVSPGLRGMVGEAVRQWLLAQTSDCERVELIMESKRSVARLWEGEGPTPSSTPLDEWASLMGSGDPVLMLPSVRNNALPHRYQFERMGLIAHTTISHGGGKSG